MAQSLAALITVVATLITTVVVCMLALRRELGRKTASTNAKVDQVHEVVNGRYTALLAHVATLTDLLNEAGLAVPPLPAELDPAPDPDAATSQH